MTVSSNQEARIPYGGEQESKQTQGIGHSLAKDPEQRPGSAAAVARAIVGRQQVDEEPEASSDDLVRKIRRLLDSQEIAAAKEAAAGGAELFPGHPWLEQANEVLNPTRVTVTPARDRGFDRRKEYDWLHQNRKEYQGRWIVLLEDQLLACADSFEDAVGQVRSHDLEARPLVHHVE